MDYSVHGILQARILEWVAFSFSRGSSQPRDRTQVSRIAGGFLTSWATREALGSPLKWVGLSNSNSFPLGDVTLLKVWNYQKRFTIVGGKHLVVEGIWIDPLVWGPNWNHLETSGGPHSQKRRGHPQQESSGLQLIQTWRAESSSTDVSGEGHCCGTKGGKGQFLSPPGPPP